MLAPGVKQNISHSVPTTINKFRRTAVFWLGFFFTACPHIVLFRYLLFWMLKFQIGVTVLCVFQELSKQEIWLALVRANHISCLESLGSYIRDIMQNFQPLIETWLEHWCRVVYFGFQSSRPYVGDQSCIIVRGQVFVELNAAKRSDALLSFS